MLSYFKALLALVLETLPINKLEIDFDSCLIVLPAPDIFTNGSKIYG
jgi:hypothetical protein